MGNEEGEGNHEFPFCCLRLNQTLFPCDLATEILKAGSVHNVHSVWSQGWFGVTCITGCWAPFTFMYDRWWWGWSEFLGIVMQRTMCLIRYTGRQDTIPHTTDHFTTWDEGYTRKSIGSLKNQLVNPTSMNLAVFSDWARSVASVADSVSAIVCLPQTHNYVKIVKLLTDVGPLNDELVEYNKHCWNLISDIYMLTRRV